MEHLLNTYYIKLVITNRKNNFLRPDVADYAIDELEYRGGAGEEMVLHICLLLPKELHMALTLTENYGKPLKNWVNAYKRYLSRNAFSVPGLKFAWEPGFDSEEIVDKDALKRKVDEIMHMPLDRGFAPVASRHPCITVRERN